MNAMQGGFIRRLSRRVSLGSLKQITLRPWLIAKIPGYLGQLSAYRRRERELDMRSAPLRWYPCLNDTQSRQRVDYYFYQDSWAARQVFREMPPWVVDIGSTVLLAGILSQFAPCVSVDVRPISARLEGLETVSASALALPFADASIPCLTTMCVLEHIGLGRYGDPLNPRGTVDAVAEISRVLAHGGVVVYSVPVGSAQLEFNANRRFYLEEARSLFDGWDKIDDCLLTPVPTPISAVSQKMLMSMRDPIACFCLRKPTSS